MICVFSSEVAITILGFIVLSLATSFFLANRKVALWSNIYCATVKTFKRTFYLACLISRYALCYSLVTKNEGCSHNLYYEFYTYPENFFSKYSTFANSLKKSDFHAISQCQTDEWATARMEHMKWHLSELIILHVWLVGTLSAIIYLGIITSFNKCSSWLSTLIDSQAVSNMMLSSILEGDSLSHHNTHCLKLKQLRYSLLNVTVIGSMYFHGML